MDFTYWTNFKVFLENRKLITTRNLNLKSTVKIPAPFHIKIFNLHAAP